MMRFMFSALAAFLLATAIGCSGNEAVSVDDQVGGPVGEAKIVLNEIGESGVVGSGVMLIESGIDTLRETDAAKADALAKSLEELQGLKDPAAIKAKAKEMASQL